MTLPDAIKTLMPSMMVGNGTTMSSGQHRMDLHGGLPFWLVRNGLGPDYPRLEEDVRTDVVIVGGGITGALCAYILTEAGIPVVVVDARAIGTGSTCASTALLQYEIDTPLHELIELVGEKSAVRSYQLCAQAVEGLGIIAKEIGMEEFTMRPSVQYASKRAHVAGLVKEHALRNANGLPAELLEGKRRCTRGPALRCAGRAADPDRGRDRRVPVHPRVARQEHACWSAHPSTHRGGGLP
ncbi:MAG: FAD-binding oxidoreductase [Flavobacteriales bacterium]|nr:FAD-binding oxidoreductase [Flavobacteriales bacterium]